MSRLSKYDHWYHPVDENLKLTWYEWLRNDIKHWEDQLKLFLKTEILIERKKNYLRKSNQTSFYSSI